MSETVLLTTHVGEEAGPLACGACGVAVGEGETIYVLTRERFPWLAEDDPGQSWEVFTWHEACDSGSPPWTGSWRLGLQPNTSSKERQLR